MYPVTPRTRPSRYASRVGYDPAEAHAILDEAYVCHLGLVADGAPRVLPTLFARLDDTLYLHGSTGSGLARDAGGTPVCVTVSLLDGLGYARAQFHHTVNYRSVVCHGTLVPVTEPADKARALAALVDKLGAGRAADTRPPNARELAATAVFALPLEEVSVKRRAGGVGDEPEDLGLPHWAGVVPVRTVLGVAEPADGVPAPLPDYLRPARSPWLTPAVMKGRHVILEPLDPCHAEELFTALDDPDVHRFIPGPRPRDAAGWRERIRRYLEEAAAGTRVPWVQRCARTGAVVGTTSFCPVDVANRWVHIGSTQIGRAWWRTGVNTEAKLLLMTRAFEELGAERVEWQTDILNVRSQAAIERLGATREGVFRRHKRRDDGTWRDSVFYSLTAPEWPAARDRLTARLARG